MQPALMSGVQQIEEAEAAVATSRALKVPSTSRAHASLA